MEILIGAVVSVLMQFIKSKFGGEYVKLAILIILCLGAAGIYTALTLTGYWQTVATVLTNAGAFYAFVIQRFEK